MSNAHSLTPTPTQHAQHGQYAAASTTADFLARWQTIQARIQAACLRVGRAPEEVRLLPVSKTVEVERLRAAYHAGYHFLAENKVQEAYQKWEALHDLPQLQWSIIGHLQTNKVKAVAKFATEFQALDRLKLAQALEDRLQAEGRSLNVLIQVNTSQEDSKFGLPPQEVAGFLRALSSFSALKVKGLMTLAMLSHDPTEVRQCFIQLRTLRDTLQQDAPVGVELNDLSMGMSGDYEIAIEEGATIVRIGQALFGARNTVQ